MALILGNIGYLLTGLALATILACFVQRVNHYIPISLTIAAYTAAAWSPAWDSPSDLASVYTLLAMFSMVMIRGNRTNRLVNILLLALASSIAWKYMQANDVGTFLLFGKSFNDIFFLQSILNCLTITLCVLVLMKCYNPTKHIGMKSQGSFYAKFTDRLIGRMQSGL